MIDWLKQTENIALIVSITALLISLWFSKKNHDLQKRTLKLEEARENIQRKNQLKAKLNHYYENNPFPTVSRLIISNEGLAKARNVAVYIDNDLLEEWEYCCREECNFSEIPSENEVSVKVLETNQMKSRWTIKITWEDDSGEQGLYEGYIEV